MNEFQMVWHIVLAAVLSGLVGLERERTDKPAGFRTHMIVGGAAALFVLLGEKIILEFQDPDRLEPLVEADPIRIIQAIIIGVSFIGAGTVLQIESDYKIKFLTTAATILFATGIGIAVALEQYILSISISVFIVFINMVLAWVSHRVNIQKRKERKKRTED
jgi:putative Mg2+ transporter-C (MgtC) family protein